MRLLLLHHEVVCVSEVDAPTEFLCRVKPPHSHQRLAEVRLLVEVALPVKLHLQLRTLCSHLPHGKSAYHVRQRACH